ncbi:MAG TPA: ZIP family metal transporter [Candidatus Paceibacterota bacterium]|nr:ZIP family metal transporter [Candidatus Paceibacterota bacterium]
MAINYLYAFISVILVSMVSLVGVFFISLKEDVLKKYIGFFISLAIGALLGDAFIHIIPEAFDGILNVNTASILIIGGIILFFIIEKFIHWHHHGEDQQDEHIHPVGKLVLFTDGFHNLIDGAIIGASFLISPHIGIATTLAVILHEIPQEIGDFAVLIHAGYSKMKALWFNFISALAAVLGLVIFFIFGNIIQNAAIWLIPVAAGGFIYIAIADLIPELHKTRNIKHSVIQVFIILLGVLSMVALTLIE